MIVSFDDLAHRPGSVLLDGVFDPLHAGHLAYIAAARDAFPHMGVVVSVASDEQLLEKRLPLLSGETRAAVVEALRGVDAVYLKDRPTEDVITQLRPVAYVKGADWEGKLPDAQIAACQAVGAQIVHLPTVTASSTQALRKWALADADASLDRLEASMAAQVTTPPCRYDREYFEGDWRTTAPPYTLEGRRKAEGRHPKIIKELWPEYTVMDVGCGPGFLVQLLREVGMSVGGIDPSLEAVNLAPHGAPVLHGSITELPDKIAHVVICREVLEHLTVADAARMVGDLFRVARKVVYITTRFHAGAIFDVTDEREVDPTHQTLLTQPCLRALCVLNGGTRRRDWESALDWQGKGRVLVYEV